MPTICSLGAEWADASKIPVEQVVEVWREQSKRGRYESTMWSAAGLEEPKSEVMIHGCRDQQCVQQLIKCLDCKQSSCMSYHTIICNTIPLPKQSINRHIPV